MSQDPIISIVEDDDAARDSLRALLESRGYSVETYNSGKNFLAKFDPEQNGCALLDVRLPDGNGLDLQQRIRERGGDFPVIVITGYGDIPMAVAAIKAGAIDFLEKPFRTETILESVERALHSEPANKQPAADASAVAAKVAQLTPREREVLDQLVIGSSNKIIARNLDISPRTAEVHRANVMKKMAAQNLSHLVRMAVAAGIDPGPP